MTATKNKPSVKEKKAHADQVESMADRKRSSKANAKSGNSKSGAKPKSQPKSTKPTAAQSMDHQEQSSPHGRRQCSAKSKRSGKRCKKAPLKGQKVCEFHGGKTPGAKAAGERRETKRKALAEASRLVDRAGVDMDPIDHLLDSLHRAAQLVNVYGIMCAEIDGSADESLSDEQTRGELGYEIVEEEVGEGKIIERFIVHAKDKLMALNKHSEAQLHPYLQAYTEALRDRAKFAKMCIDAGIAEMQMQLVERQVDMAQEALEATLAEMKLKPKQRQKFMHTHARHLRDIGCRGSSVGPGTMARVRGGS